VNSFPTNSDASAPILNAGLDESDWNVVRPGTCASLGEMPLYEGRMAVYRVHLQLSEADLSAPGVRIQFYGCNNHGWYFVNGQLVGESRKWEAQPSFDIRQHLHPGDNVIAVGVQHGGRWGGLNPNVLLEISPKVSAVNWSRSLFNGLAQVIVQSEKTPGVIKLTATADGLKPAAATVETHPASLRSFAP
jgi:beta-galactosidase